MEERKRVRRACHPCKIRKRRCDGNEPCSVCTRLEDTCYYEKPQRKRRRKTQPEAESPEPHLNGHARTTSHIPSPEDLQAHSADALPARIEERLTHSPNPGFKGASAWNLGVSQIPGTCNWTQESGIDMILRYKEIQALSETYFRTFNVVWGFLNEEAYFRALNHRTWLVSNHASDPVFFGVALIGSYFQNGGSNDLQCRLFDALDVKLSRYATAEGPSIQIGAALVLKTNYLRLTGTAYATWRCSCNSINAIETIPASQDCPPFIDRDRLYAAANMAQFAISSESGRPSMRLLPPPSTDPPSLKDWDMYRLHSVYFTLTPDNSASPASLEESIQELCEMNISEDAARLAQACCAFTFFRRLRFQQEDVPLVTIMRVLDVGSMALAAARRLVEQRLPWWNLLVVPFQYLCAILVIDCPVSLRRVRDALDTLKAVAATFPSNSTKDALERVQKMIILIRKRKHDEASILDRSLAEDEVDGDNINGQVDGHLNNGQLSFADGPETLAWGNLDWYNFDEAMLPRYDFDMAM